MHNQRSGILLAVVMMGVVWTAWATLGAGRASAQDAAPGTVARRIGAIKVIHGNALTLTPDSGAEIAVTVQPNTRILRIAPGEKDLKNATLVQLLELQAGDRVRVRGQASGDGTSISALEIIVMARSDLEARHQQEQQDWQKRGFGGMVSAVDTATGTVTVSVAGLSGTKNTAIHTSKDTVIRRYSPDSVKFDDAKPSTLQDIHPGDQMRARGERTPDGSEMTAEEIVTGRFRNVAGTVNSVDASAGTVSIQDLLSKKPVVVKITAESQMHKLPAQFAQGIAMRLKGGAASEGTGASGGAPAPSGGSQPSAPSDAKPSGAPASGSAGNGGMGVGMRPGRGDFQQMLGRMPAITLADLQKGDAVMIVATEGTAAGSTAITLLSGVEPILQAAPSQATMLTPWSLGSAPGGDAQ